MNKLEFVYCRLRKKRRRDAKQQQKKLSRILNLLKKDTKIYEKGCLESLEGSLEGKVSREKISKMVHSSDHQHLKP